MASPILDVRQFHSIAVLGQDKRVSKMYFRRVRNILKSIELGAERTAYAAGIVQLQLIVAKKRPAY